MWNVVKAAPTSGIVHDGIDLVMGIARSLERVSTIWRRFI